MDIKINRPQYPIKVLFIFAAYMITFMKGRKIYDVLSEWNIVKKGSASIIFLG